MADISITLGELIAAHHSALPACTEGWFASELAEASGIHVTKIRQMLKVGIKAGIIERGEKIDETIGGWSRMQTCYRLASKGKKAKK